MGVEIYNEMPLDEVKKIKEEALASMAPDAHKERIQELETKLAVQGEQLEQTVMEITTMLSALMGGM